MLLEDQRQTNTYSKSLNFQKKNGQFTSLGGSISDANSGWRDFKKLWFVNADYGFVMADHMSESYESGAGYQAVAVGNNDTLYWDSTGGNLSSQATTNNYHLHTPDAVRRVSDPNLGTTGWRGGPPLSYAVAENDSWSGTIYAAPLTTPITSINTWAWVEWWANGRRLYEDNFYSVPKITPEWPTKYQQFGGVDKSVYFNHLTGADPAAVVELTGNNPRFDNIGLG